MSERIDALVDDRTDRSVKLKANGLLFGGWESITAEVGIEQCSGGFELSVMDRWSVDAEPLQIHPGDQCELLIANQTVITGYVDTRKPRMDTKSHSIRITGRDKTADLVDCSAIYRSGQWKGVKLDRIARDIADPFHIDVHAEVDVGDPFDSFHIEEGEHAFETIDRAARMRGLLVMTDGTGRLILTRASTQKADVSLVQGVNVLEAELDHSWKERYSEIIVKGQGKGSSTDFADKVAHGKGSTTDPAITRYRPLIVISEHHGRGPTFAQRAEWERNVRRGRGTRAIVRVQGWTTDAGIVWKPNVLVPVDIPYLGIQEELLIARCVYRKSEHGTVTDLQLAHPSAFQVLAGVRGTGLNRKITGVNGLESNRRHAREHARSLGRVGSIIDFETGEVR